MRQQTLADDVAHRHARVQAGIRILENELQVAAELADLVVFKARKVDALVAQRLVARKFRVVRILRPLGVELLADVADLARKLGELFVDLREAGAQLGLLALEAARVLAVLLGLLDVKEQVVQIELHRAAAVHLLHALLGNAVFLQEQLLHRLNVLHADKAADQVRHIQQRVVLILDRLIQLVVLLVLRLAVRQRVVFLLHIGQMLFQLVPLFAALFERLQRLFDVNRREIVQRAAVVHRPAVRLAVELEQRAAQRGLAAAALADQTEGLALVDIQRNAVVGLDVKALLLQREVLLEVADAKQHLLPLVI